MRLSLIVCAWLPLTGLPAADLAEAWRLGAQARFVEAEAALPVEATEDEAKFARAILRFNHQPRTAATMDEAVALLAGLAEKAATPELRARSLYFWARAEDLRQTGAAAALYERLWREYPAEPFGQRALVHQLLVAFYTDAPREQVLARCAELEALADRLTDSKVRGHFHQVAARGYLQLGGAEAKALTHLLAVERIGVARREARGDLQVSIGQLAAQLGRPDLARVRYTAFLREFPHDPRAYTVRALLAGLTQEGKAKP